MRSGVLFRRCFIFLFLCISAARISFAQLPDQTLTRSSKLGPSAAQELVRQAIDNYKARQLKVAYYTWVEYQMTRWFYREGPTRMSDAYDVIPLGGNVYRRHLLHNDQPLPPQEEKEEQEKFQSAVLRIMREEVKIPSMKDPGTSGQGDLLALKSDAPDKLVAEMESTASEQLRESNRAVERAGPDASVLSQAVSFSKPLANLQLPIEQLPDAFEIRWKRIEVLNGRETDVLEATPDSFERRNIDKEAIERKFKMTIWIDQRDTEIVKVQGGAVKSGVLSSKPEYAFMDTRNYSKSSRDKAKQMLYEQSLHYSRGTVITEEWSKINDEVWMPARHYVKGKVIYTHYVVLADGTVGEGSPTFPFEYEITYLRYQKFRVGARILPAKPQ